MLSKDLEVPPPLGPWTPAPVPPPPVHLPPPSYRVADVRDSRPLDGENAVVLQIIAPIVAEFLVVVAAVGCVSSCVRKSLGPIVVRDVGAVGFVACEHSTRYIVAGGSRGSRRPGATSCGSHMFERMWFRKELEFGENFGQKENFVLERNWLFVGRFGVFWEEFGCWEELLRD